MDFEQEMLAGGQFWKEYGFTSCAHLVSVNSSASWINYVAKMALFTKALINLISQYYILGGFISLS